MSSDPLLRFSHYRVLQREDGSPWVLGRGAMGLTYKAFDERLRLEVALKVISPQRLHEPSVQALFLREARSAARVRHSNVASVLALDDTPGNFYYAMEFVPGVTLSDFLVRRQRLEAPFALDLAAQVAHGLDAIHAQGIIHRDLKPANLMLVPRRDATPTEEGSPAPLVSWTVKVIDFGLARRFDGDLAADATAAVTTTFRGTVMYASPEQCLERADLDGRADLYSLGCILWEMLCGAPPFRARSHHELMSQHVSRPLPLAQFEGQPGGLAELLVRLLAKDPADRFSSAAQAARAMEKLATHIRGVAPVAAPARPPSSLAPTPATTEAIRPRLRSSEVASTLAESGPPPPRNRTWLAAAGMAVLLLSLGLGLWVRNRPEPPAAAQRKLSASKAVAVLPFTNVGGDKANEVFTEGISEEILIALSRLTGLRVAARGSAFAFQGKTTSMAEIARQLGVDYLLEGSVRSSGERVRVTARLVQVSDGFQVWSDVFERELKDLFAIQDEIAGLIARSLQVQLGTAPLAARNVPPEAIRVYLEGRVLWQRRTHGGFEPAEAAFRRALELAPDFARAVAGLTDVLTARVDRLVVESPASIDSPEARAMLAQARALAERALQLDPGESEALASLAFVCRAEGDVPRTIALLRQALLKNPSNAQAHQRLARTLAADGQMDEALEHAARAVELDPLAPRLHDNYALLLLLARRPAEALLRTDRGLALERGNLQLRGWRVWALSELDRCEEASAIAREILAQPITTYHFLAIRALARCGQREEARQASNAIPPAHRLARAYAWTVDGRVEEGLAELQSLRLPSLAFEALLYDPAWDAVRSDPRFQAVLAAHRLTEGHARAQAWLAARRKM